MNHGKAFVGLLLAALLGAGAVPASAEVHFQCPTLPGGSFGPDTNGDGMLRADDGEITLPVSPRQVCMHLVSGDGFVNMADKTIDHGDGTGVGKLQYIFVV